MSRDRVSLFTFYLLSTSSAGFVLPFLPLVLKERGLTAGQIGLVSTAASLSAILQFPMGVASDRFGSRKPLLLAAIGLLGAGTFLLSLLHQFVWVFLLAAVVAENGAARAVVEALSGAEMVSRSDPSRTASALGTLQFIKPLGIIIVALITGWLAASYGVEAMLMPLAVLQLAAVVCCLVLPCSCELPAESGAGAAPVKYDWRWLRDGDLIVFFLAMVLFHAANAPVGTYLGLYLEQSFDAGDQLISYAFVITMTAWLLCAMPGGRLADRWGTRRLLVACWLILFLRLGTLAIAGSAWQVVATQVFDGAANGLFAVLAAAWVTGRMNDRGRLGTVQVVVGISIVVGASLGPAVAAVLVGPLGFRAMFGVLAALSLAGTLILVFFVPEYTAGRERPPAVINEPAGALRTP